MTETNCGLRKLENLPVPALSQQSASVQRYFFRQNASAWFAFNINSPQASDKQGGNTQPIQRAHSQWHVTADMALSHSKILFHGKKATRLALSRAAGQRAYACFSTTFGIHQNPCEVHSRSETEELEGLCGPQNSAQRRETEGKRTPDRKNKEAKEKSKASRASIAKIHLTSLQVSLEIGSVGQVDKWNT